MFCNRLEDVVVREHDGEKRKGKAEYVHAQDEDPRLAVTCQVVKGTGGLETLEKNKANSLITSRILTLRKIAI